VAKPAIDAVSRYMNRGGANLHGAFPTSGETEEILREARQAAADFLGARADEISFGANMTTITFAISEVDASNVVAVTTSTSITSFPTQRADRLSWQRMYSSSVPGTIC